MIHSCPFCSSYNIKISQTNFTDIYSCYSIDHTYKATYRLISTDILIEELILLISEYRDISTEGYNLSIKNLPSNKEKPKCIIRYKKFKLEIDHTLEINNSIIDKVKTYLLFA